jgi:hypothetical protein
MGGASAAHPSDNSAITVNPGVIALESRYDIGALFGYGPTQDIGWGMSVSDSQTNEWIGFGASYYGSVFDPPFRNDELPGWSPVGIDPINMKRTHTVGVGVGSALWDRRIGLGLSGYLTGYNNKYVGNGMTGNMDVGLGVRPAPWVSLGVVGRNVLPVPDQSDTPTSVRTGLRIQTPPWFAIAADLDWQTEEVAGVAYSVGTGIEGGVSQARARVGYRFDGVFQQHAATWGLGAESDAGAIEYAMVIPVGPDQGAADIVHMISIRVYAGKIRDMMQEMEDEMGF